MTRRLLWATDHEALTINDWSKWVFSDECSVEVTCQEGRVRIWGRWAERFKQENCKVMKQQGGGKVMVWGMISYNRLFPLERVFYPSFTSL